mgnify:CR=1 FL=1
MRENERPALRVQLIIVTELYALPYFDGRATELGNDLKDLTVKYEKHPAFASFTPATTFTTLTAQIIRDMPDSLVERILIDHGEAITRLYDQIPSRSDEHSLRTAA